MKPRPDLPDRDLSYVVAQTRTLWEQVRRQAIFVTGGTGFVGRWMLGSLLAANDELGLGVQASVLSRWPEAFAASSPELAGHPAVTLLNGDVASFDFPDGAHSHILHLAKEPDPTPTAGDRGSASGTARVLDFAASCGASTLLFTSSGAVYGPQPDDVERLREDDHASASPDDPNAVYAHSKRAAEALCLTAAGSGLSVKIARCFTFVGPFMDFEAGYAAGNFIRDAVCRDAIRVHGDGTPLRSYLYAADLAVWLWTVLFAGDSATPYNVGSSAAVSIADLARLVARRTGGGKPVRISRLPAPSAPPDRYVPDTSLAAARLGLTVGVSLDEAIDRTAEWYRSASCPR